MSTLLEKLKNGLPSRLNRFRRIMFVEIDRGMEGIDTAVTSNISARGMAVICDADLEPGDEAWVTLGSDAPIPARVIWRDGRRLGFRFDREFDMIRSLGNGISASRRIAPLSASRKSAGWK